MSKHHNQRGEKPRVKLAGGPLIDHQTLAHIERWHKSKQNMRRRRPLSVGLIVDFLVVFAVAEKFNPVTFARFAKKHFDEQW